MEAVFLEPDGGEVVSESDERWVVIKSALEHVTVTESRYAAGERGPEPHVHRKHADAFYVLAGSLVFGLGPGARETVHAEAGSLVLVPIGVVHTFGNDGPGDARFLNIHAPSGGFADYLRAERDGDEAAEDRFDTYDPPDDGGRPAAEAIVRPSGDGERVKAGAAEALFKAERGDGDGTFSLSETTLPPDFPGLAPHRHETFVDSFYVLDGTLSVQLGEEDVVDAAPGAFALVPPGTAHTFSNTSGSAVRSLNLMAPGGFEQYLKEVAKATRSGPADPQLMAGIASKYDFHPIVQAY